MLGWDLYNALANISAFSVVIPILFIFRKRNQSSVLKLLFIYLVLSLLTESILFFISRVGRSNLYAVEIFKILELLLIMGMFNYSNLFNERQVNYLKIIPIVGCVFLLTGFALNWTGLFDGFEHTCIIFLSVLAFYRLFLISDQMNTNIHSFFWFNLAFFLYFSASFFLFLFGNLVRTFDEVGILLWTIHLLANMLFYYLLSVGIWKQKVI